jgi:hypothetical protein
MRTRSLLPRLEYPRPDRQRSFLQGVDWLNLNGAWEFRFDADDRDRDKRWFDSDEQHWPDQIMCRFAGSRSPRGVKRMLRRLTVYGYDAGRYPLGPTVIID